MSPWVGACIGSFIHVVAIRLPLCLFHEWHKVCIETIKQPPFNITNSKLPKTPEGFIFSRSKCPACKQKLVWWHTIPIVSYLLLKGRCGHCQTACSIRYPLVEGLTALTTVHLVGLWGITPQTGWALILLYALITLSLMDMDHQLLPDIIVIPLLWIGLWVNTSGYFTDLPSAIYGVIGGYGSLWLVFHIHHQLTGKVGMGHGDFKLLAALGAWLGWQSLPFIVFAASFVATVVALVMLLRKRKTLQDTLPFGPYLALAGWIMLLYGNQLKFLYRNLTGL